MDAASAVSMKLGAESGRELRSKYVESSKLQAPPNKRDKNRSGGAWIELKDL